MNGRTGEAIDTLERAASAILGIAEAAAFNFQPREEDDMQHAQLYSGLPDTKEYHALDYLLDQAAQSLTDTVAPRMSSGSSLMN